MENVCEKDRTVQEKLLTACNVKINAGRAVEVKQLCCSENDIPIPT